VHIVHAGGAHAAPIPGVDLCKITKGAEKMKYYPQWKPGTPCHNNGAVICSDHSQCARCGWNPEVAEKRSAAVEEELKQKRRSLKNG
jgi:hypothetical protein